MDYNILKQDLEKEGKIMVNKGDPKDPYKVFVPDRAKLRVTQVSGSCAGAGSGDFHVYRNGRRKERFRKAQILAEAEKREKFENFIKRKEEAYLEQKARTAKKAAKRKRRKEAQRIWKKKKKGEAQNQFNNDGSFLETFKRQQEAAQTDFPKETMDKLKKILKKKSKGPKSNSAAKDFFLPIVSREGEDVVVSTKEAGDNHQIQWFIVKDSDGKIVGGKSYTENQSKGKALKMRLTGVQNGAILHVFAFGSSGLWRADPFTVKQQRKQKLFTSANTEGIAMRLVSMLELQSQAAIRARKRFHVAISPAVAEVLSAANIKCEAEVKNWSVFFTNCKFQPKGKLEPQPTHQSKVVLLEILTRWGVPKDNIFDLNADLKDADEAAASYAQEISRNVPGEIDPQFDLIIAALSEKGGICGLEPGSKSITNQDLLVAAEGEGLGKEVMFTIPLLNCARTLGVVVTRKEQEDLSSSFDEKSDGPLSRITDPIISWCALDGASL